MTIDRSCGPEGCRLDWLVSPRLAVDGRALALHGLGPAKAIQRPS